MHESESEVAQLCLTLRNPMDCSYQAPPSVDFPGTSTGVGCHCLLRSLGDYLAKKGRVLKDTLEELDSLGPNTGFTTNECVT